MKTIFFTTVVTAVVALVAVTALLIISQLASAKSTISSSSSPLTPNPKPKNGWVKQVTHLPGMTGPLDVPLFSGMTEVDAPPPHHSKIIPTKVFQSYHIFGSVSGDAEDVPLCLGFPGGPGAPDLFFGFVEFARYRLSQESYTTPEYKQSKIPEPIKNDFSINDYCILISFGSAPPTGFSYCEPAGPAGKGDSCGTWNDTRVGVANAEALLVALSDHFPNLLPQGTSRKVYSLSESYGGVFSTATLEQVLTKPKYSFIADRLAGAEFGDACMGSAQICGGGTLESSAWWHQIFMFGHEQMPADLFDAMMEVCGGKEGLLRVKPQDYSLKCKLALKQCNEAVGSYYNYNLYNECPGRIFDSSLRPPSSYSPRHSPHRRIRRLGSRTAIVLDDSSSSSSSSPPGGITPTMDGFWCAGNVMHEYFNRSDVRAAFGVAQDSNFFMEDNAVGLPYDFTMKDAFAFWKKVLDGEVPAHRPASSPKIKLMSMNADADPAVNGFYTQYVWYEFAKNMSYAKTKEWSNYKMDGVAAAGDPTITAGSWVHFGDRLIYSTLRGSGHMSGLYDARGTYSLFKQWIFS